MDKTAFKAAMETFKKRLADAHKSENVKEQTKAAVEALLKDLNVAKSKND